MKFAEEIMEILAAFDLTGSYRDAGELAGCSHNTVGRLVVARDAGLLTAEVARRAQIIDPYLDKIEEWVELSRGVMRADVAFDKLVAMGYSGSERTARRAVAAVKASWAAGKRRVYRPWVPEPGLWFQYDFGDGPMIGGRKTTLFCAWLAWSRFRVVLPILDKTLPSVIACIDVTLRRFGGCPTYALTDNEKTVTVEHVAGIAIRNPVMVAAARFYGLSVKTCVPYDPESKGGSEATVRVAKADLVPTAANLLADYENFAALDTACDAFSKEINARPHRVTRRAPVEMLAEEASRLHPLPANPYTVAFGVTRTVGTTTAMVAFEGGSYSAPHRLGGAQVWVRAHGEDVIVVHVGADGPVEVARHLRTTPGNPRLDDSHFEPRHGDPLNRRPKAATGAESEFLALGEGAATWLVEAGEAGAGRVRAKMARAVELAKIIGVERVDWALGHAAVMGRFADGDLESILDHAATAKAGAARQASEDHSLQGGTKGWEGFGR
ncbi:MAG TPA: IS21 family transposase [Acidimicrobiales bacterium]|nr:IS21 family transposase [Acidimicrobiales bacterium]